VRAAAGRARAPCAKVAPVALRPQAAEAAETSVVSLDHIGKRYANGIPVLSEISLTLEAGGFYFLTGSAGAGKTTLLRLICLAERPSQGRLLLFGSEPAALDREGVAALRRRIGVVFQDLRLIDGLSVSDNVALPLRIAGADERSVAANVPELLSWVGLEDRADMPAATLSAGERQRVAIARAVVHSPELLIADEPAGHVDDEVALLLVRVFERINALGTTVLIASHDPAFASRFAHQRFHLDRGTLSSADTVFTQ
jgi:cell division transport system ATP-binding protein